jgi:hypothetical protein
MHCELFTDGVSEVTVSGTVVRVDLVSLSPTERDENNAPKRVLRQRLIFPLEGFANSVELMQKALQGLIDAGAVTRSQPRSPVSAPSGTPASARAPAAAETARAANASPNFR